MTKTTIPFAEKNSFIQREARPVKFDQDLKLFKKVFPDHKLIPVLENKNKYNSQQLHERMLLTLLQAKTPAEIRGKSKTAPPPVDNTSKTGLDAKSWNEVKALAKELKISSYRKSRPTLQLEITEAQKKNKQE
jgi:hypothetical protein